MASAGVPSTVSQLWGNLGTDIQPTPDEEKLAAIDAIINEIAPELKQKKVSLSVLPMLQRNLIAYALTQSRLEGQVDILKQENARLRQQVEMQTEKLKTAPTLPQTSFAAVVASSKGKNSIETKIENAKAKQATTLFIRSTIDKDPKQVREVLTIQINPCKEKLKIKAVRTTPKVLIIETETKEDCQKLQQKASAIKDIKCETTKKRRPLITIQHVSDTYTEQVLLEEIYELNLSEHMTKEEYSEEAKFRFKTRPKGKGFSNNVLEVSPRVRNILLGQGRVFLGFQSLYIKDFVAIPHCFRCCDLDHTIEHCTRKQIVCANCGEEGHKKS